MNKRNDIEEFYLDSNCSDSYSINDSDASEFLQDIYSRFAHQLLTQ